MSKEKLDLLQGTLDMLILKAVALEPMHGFGISVRIRQMSGVGGNETALGHLIAAGGRLSSV